MLIFSFFLHEHSIDYIKFQHQNIYGINEAVNKSILTLFHNYLVPPYPCELKNSEIMQNGL